MSWMRRSGPGCRAAAGAPHGRLAPVQVLRQGGDAGMRHAAAPTDHAGCSRPTTPPCPPPLCRSYQLCLFCYDRLKTEFSNRCPNCREEYDSDFNAGLRRRQERAAQVQREKEAAREAARATAAAAAAERGAGGRAAGPPPPPPPRTKAPHSPRSPRRDLHIEQEQLWPSLGAAAQAAVQQQHHAHAAPHAPRAEARRVASPPQLAPILPQPAATVADVEASSTSSSDDTTTTTPQSPVSSVVCFRAAPLATKPAAAVQGRCAVLLQRGGCGLGVEVRHRPPRCCCLCVPSPGCLVHMLHGRLLSLETPEAVAGADDSPLSATWLTMCSPTPRAPAWRLAYRRRCVQAA